MMNANPTEAARLEDRPHSQPNGDAILPAITKLEHIPELLADIFLLCLPYGDVLPDARKPYNFTQVCRAWRVMALSKPLLWSRFTLSGYNCDSKREDRILDAWLRRSGRVPLTVRMCLYGRGTLGEVLWRCMVVLLMHANRWADVSVAMPWPFIRHILRQIGKKTPQLHSLMLIRTGAIIPSVYVKPISDESLQEQQDVVPGMPRHWKKTRYGGNWRDCFVNSDNEVSLPLKALPIKVKSHVSTVPTLRRITLDGLVVLPPVPHPGRLRNSSKAVQKFWDLQHLTLNYVCADFAIKILQASLPSLETFSISITRDVTLHNHHVGRTQTNFPSLLNMEVHAHYSRDCISLILGIITAPRLKKLTIAAHRLSIDSQIGDFLRRSRPPLTHLRISGLTLPEAAMINMLREVPSLQFFYADSATMSNDILMALTMQTRSVLHENPDISAFEGLCAGLKRLELDIDGKFTGSAIVTMLLSRWKTQDRSLKEVYLKRVSTSSATHVLGDPAISQCIDEGLRLFI